MGDTVIAIPTYFGSQMVANCLSSILKNVSKPEVLIYKNDEGWLKACNRAIKNTTTDIILLNDDTLVLSDIVSAMSELAYSDPTIGIVGAKALASNGEVIVNYGIYVAPDGNTAHRYYGQPKDSVDVEEQKAVEGSCMFIKRELIEEIGLLEEQYGMGYRAEVSYCFLAREAGYRVVSSPKAEYVHFSSQTAGALGIANDTHEIFLEQWGTKLALGTI